VVLVENLDRNFVSNQKPGCAIDCSHSASADQTVDPVPRVDRTTQHRIERLLPRAKGFGELRFVEVGIRRLIGNRRAASLAKTGVTRVLISAT